MLLLFFSVPKVITKLAIFLGNFFKYRHCSSNLLLTAASLVINCAAGDVQ